MSSRVMKSGQKAINNDALIEYLFCFGALGTLNSHRSKIYILKSRSQEEAIRSKVKNLAAIEELERLFPLLKEAVNAELADKVGAKAVEIELKAKEGASIEIAEQACNCCSFLPDSPT